MIILIRIFLLALSILFQFAAIRLPLALAENFSGGWDESDPYSSGEELTLYVGEVKSFIVSEPVRAAVGNPDIADITSVTNETIVVTPKAKGSTTFSFSDNLGEHSFILRILAEDLTDDFVQINSLLKELNQPDVYARLVETQDKILLKGKVKTLNDKEQTLSALGSLKDKTIDLIEIKEEETTIDIDVEVLEFDKGLSKTLGFTMPSSITAAEPAGKYPQALSKSMDAIFHVFDWPRTSLFNVKLDALIEEGRVRVLSRPRLACQSGKEAELLVGGEKPILTTQVAAVGGAAGTSVSYKEFGIKLKIKPVVTENGRIKIALNVEVSDVGEAEILGNIGATTAKAFPLSKRSASTELFMNSGQTLGIGGLVKEKEEKSVSKTAFLGDIPIIGLLFRNKTTKIGGGAGTGERGNVELVILMTPKIIPSKENSLKPAFITSGAEGPVSSPQYNSDVGRRPLSNYARTVREYILGNFKYPSFARDYAYSGTVKLSLRLAPGGELLEVKLKESSGHKDLDDYTLSVVKGISAYPPFPPSIDAKELLIDIPIVYSLN